MPRTSLYRGSLYRGSTVLRSTGNWAGVVFNSLNSGTVLGWGGGGGGNFDQFPAQPRNRKLKEATVSQ